MSNEFIYFIAFVICVFITFMNVQYWHLREAQMLEKEKKYKRLTVVRALDSESAWADIQHPESGVSLVCLPCPNGGAPIAAHVRHKRPRHAPEKLELDLG